MYYLWSYSLFTQITKKNVDRGGTNELYSACVIAVSATSVAKHPLSYEIPLTGTIENIIINIKLAFKSLGMQKYHPTPSCRKVLSVLASHRK